jgi:hypothetical protein
MRGEFSSPVLECNLASVLRALSDFPILYNQRGLSWGQSMPPESKAFEIPFGTEHDKQHIQARGRYL